MPKTAATRTWTYTVSTIPTPRRSTSSLEPGCGPDAVATAPVTTSAMQTGRPAQVTSRRSQRGPAGRREPVAQAPGFERGYQSQPERREPEQEVGHDRERVQVERDRDAAHRNLRDRDEKRTESGPATPVRELRDAPRSEPGEECEDDADERYEAIAELDECVKTLLRIWLVAATRPVLAAEPGTR